MTPSEEKTAEERARELAQEDVFDHRHGETDFGRYAYDQRLANIKANDEVRSLRLTNQRLETEVERMKRVASL